MKLWAVTMVKDEQDIIEHTLRHLLAHGVDGILIADNLSMDKTPRIIQNLAEEFRGRIIPVTDRERAFYQAGKMSILIGMTKKNFNADWVIPFDADELWITKDSRTLKDVVSDLPEGDAFHVDVFNHVPTFTDNREENNPYFRMQHRRERHNPWRKVIVRSHLAVTQGNHYAEGIEAAKIDNIQIRHFPSRSESQFVRKITNGWASLKNTDIPEVMGPHWRYFGQMLDEQGEEALREHYRSQIIQYADASEIVHDPGPLREPSRILA